MSISASTRFTPSVADYIAGVRTGDRAVLARAITLVESTKREHNRQAQALLQELLPATGGAVRVGITGVPGVGKSTTIDQLGINLVAAAGQEHHQEKIDHVRDGDLGLADTHGLDNDYVEARRRLAQGHGLACFSRDAAKRPRRGRRPDESSGALR